MAHYLVPLMVVRALSPHEIVGRWDSAIPLPDSKLPDVPLMGNNMGVALGTAGAAVLVIALLNRACRASVGTHNAIDLW